MAARDRKPPTDEAAEQVARRKSELQAELEQLTGVRFEGGYLDLAYGLVQLRYRPEPD